MFNYNILMNNSNTNSYTYKDFVENCIEFTKITSNFQNFKWKLSEFKDTSLV